MDGGDKLTSQAVELGRARCLVIGDVMLDRFIYGQVDRLSPEAPIPILQVERIAPTLGGAGNVVRGLRALGVETTLLAVVGNDTEGQVIRDLLQNESVATDNLLVEASRSTTVKQRYVAAGQQLLRVDRETTKTLEATTRAALVTAAEVALRKRNALILSDYGKGVLEPKLLSILIKMARDLDVPIVVDPTGRNFRVYAGASVVTPNRKELQEATGLPVTSDAEVVAACRRVIDEFGIDAVLATRSEAGMTLVQGLQTETHFPTAAREVFDVSGAGDTVVAVLAAGLAVGHPMDVCVRLANTAAGVVVGKLGTAVASQDELCLALHIGGLSTAPAKIVDLEAAVAAVGRWKDADLSVGFTNGCFDLLHPGHLWLLEQSRAACDRLVVGLNSDSSIARLKGRGRPIQSEKVRAAVLASLAFVDMVVVYKEDTPMSLLRALKPDLLTKGADYTRETLVGGDFVESYGGKVLLNGLLPGYSTTRIIEKLKS